MKRDERQDELEQELLELHFGCHPDPDALRARLAADPDLADLAAEVAEKARLLESAARAPMPAVDLSAPPAAHQVGWWHSRTRRVLAAAAAAAVITTPFLGYWAWRAWDLHSVRRDTVRITLTGPDAVPDGAPFQFAVEARDVDAEPVACALTWAVLDADGTPIAKGQSICDGDLTVAVPATLVGARKVLVEADTPTGARELFFEIDPSNAAPLVQLSTDKPVYRPGEVAFLRAVVLDRLTLEPRASTETLLLRVLDPHGSATMTMLVPPVPPEVGHGTSAAVWPIPADAAGGRYKLELSDPQGRSPSEELEFVVRRFQPPQLAKTLTLDRETYAPGAGGTAELEVARMAGGPAAGASVEASLVIDGESVWNGAATLDAGGRVLFRFAVPDRVELGAARFVARVQDGGVVETAVEPFVVPTGKVEVELFPEGGELVAGLPGRVYAEVHDPLGRPVSASGKVVDADGHQVAPFRTEHQGRGAFELTPRAGMTYRLVLTDPSEHEVQLPSPRDHGVALRALQDDTAPGEPLRLRVASTDPGRLLIGAFCRGVLVGQASVDGGALRDVEVPVLEQAFGVLRVTVFDAKLRPLAERLVHRAPARSIAVAIEPKRAAVAPGERQTLRVRATDEHGDPVVAALGLTVSDSAVQALLGEPRIGILDQANLLGDVGPLDDLATFLPGNAGAGHHVDLLLGTRGWRRFVWLGDEEAHARLAARGEDAARLIAREGHAALPAVRVSEPSRVPALGAAQRDEWRAGGAARTAAILAGLAVLLYVLLEAAIGLARRVGLSRSPIGDVLVGVACAAGAFFLLAVPFGQLGSPADQFIYSMFEGSEPDAWLYSGIGAAEPGVAVIDLNAYGQGIDEGDVAYIRDFDVQVAQAAASPAPEAGEEVVELEIEGLIAHDEAGPAFLPHLRFPGQAGPAGPSTPGPAGPSTPRPSTGYLPIAREYAHRHAGGRERSDFTETLYWNALLVTSADGTAEVSFDCSDRVTTWSADVDAHGQGRVGQGRATFDSRLPFHLEAKLPVEVTAGDRLELPVALSSEDAAIAAAEVRVELGGALSTEGAGHYQVQLEGGKGRLLVPARVTDSTEPSSIAIAGAAGRFQDRVRQPIRVVPRGFPHRRSFAGRLDSTTTFTVPMPQSVAPGSATATLKVFPSPLSTMREGLQGILQEPCGCFEQASSTNYPNLMVLGYLDATGDSIPSVAADARELLPKGYRLIAGYECSERGYEWFGGNPGHEALTAYGLMEFRDMAGVFDGVDQEMVARTRTWLLSRRDGSGGFERNARSLDSFGSAPPAVTDAYVTYALLYGGTPPADLAAELDRLAARAATTADAYELAVTACALEAAGRQGAADTARSRLGELQQQDGSLCGSTTSITSSGGRDLRVETTSFAVLAWLGDTERRHEGRARQAVEYVQSQQTARGTFGASQATIMALKALTAHAQQSRRMPAGGSIEVLVGGTPVARRDFAADQPDALVVDLLPALRPGDNEVQLVLHGGGGELPWAFDLGYHTDRPADDPDGKVTIRTALATDTVEEGKTVAVDVRVENRTAEGLPMTMAIVGLPAGLEAPTEVLDDLKDGGRVDLWELRGREVVFYWRGMAPEETREVTLDLVARIPGTTTGPASRAYLYYTADAKRWAEPLRVTVQPAGR